MRRPWYPPDWPDWHYPDPNWPAARDFPYNAEHRNQPCPLCGAPPRAACVTRHGKPTSNHLDRGNPNRT